MRPVPILAIAVLAAVAPRPAVAKDAGVKPLLAYAGAINGVAAGGRSKAGTYVHTLTGGAQAPIGGDWSFTVQGGWTAGAALSDRAIGDVAGVQGAFNSGDGFWVYEVKATYQTETGMLQAGRLSASDAMPGVAGMSQFVNSAFSSNGGAISVNDAGRATAPAASWGAWGTRTAGPLELRGGTFLSDPRRMTLHKHGLDLSFRPADGMLAFAEAATPVGGGWRAGMGAYHDSARLQAFDGRNVRGNEGYYLWLERPAPKAGGLSGFVMAQAAPRRDRNVEPVFLIAGATWQGLVPLRPSDALSLGAASGRFSGRSPLRGHETTVEANYRMTVTEHVNLRPDIQWVIAPGGRGGGRNALVLGLQLEAGL